MFLVILTVLWNNQLLHPTIIRFEKCFDIGVLRHFQRLIVRPPKIRIWIHATANNVSFFKNSCFKYDNHTQSSLDILVHLFLKCTYMANHNCIERGGGTPFAHVQQNKDSLQRYSEMSSELCPHFLWLPIVYCMMCVVPRNIAYCLGRTVRVNKLLRKDPDLIKLFRIHDSRERLRGPFI